MFTASPGELKPIHGNDLGFNLFLRIHFCSEYSVACYGLSFCSSFWKCCFDVFKSSFLVSLCKALVDQVCWVQEMVPAWFRSCQWSTLFLTGKWTEFRLISHTNKVWACSNSSFSSDYSVPFWVCLTVVFSEMADLLCSSAVSCSVYVERFWIKCAECRKWIRNAAEVGS